MLIKLSLNDSKVREYNQNIVECRKEHPKLDFRKIKTMEDCFIPYSKVPNSSALDKYIQVQKDYRSKEDFDGIYICPLIDTHMIERITDYKVVMNFGSPVDKLGYGVADNASQILDNHERLCREYPGYAEYVENRDFVILMMPEFREDQPEKDGWRWERNGDYIGKFEPKYDYLRDEKGIDFVWVFETIEVERIKDV